MSSWTTTGFTKPQPWPCGWLNIRASSWSGGPRYCPRANPIERAFGDVHDKCTRNHKRTAVGELVADVKRHLRWNGPWRYRLSELYYALEVEAALAEMNAAQ